MIVPPLTLTLVLSWTVATAASHVLVLALRLLVIPLAAVIVQSSGSGGAPARLLLAVGPARAFRWGAPIGVGRDGSLTLVAARPPALASASRGWWRGDGGAALRVDARLVVAAAGL